MLVFRAIRARRYHRSGQHSGVGPAGAAAAPARGDDGVAGGTGRTGAGGVPHRERDCTQLWSLLQSAAETICESVEELPQSFAASLPPELAELLLARLACTGRLTRTALGAFRGCAHLSALEIEDSALINQE
jgi:hypothetical protein